jgi:fermentation-respiration switch protein FrsA (DUF1100 family)
MPSIMCPVLLIHGKNDKTIDKRHSEELFKLIRHPVKKFVENDAMDHAVEFVRPHVLEPIHGFLGEIDNYNHR